MKTKEIQFEQDGFKASVVVAEANVLRGTKRTRLRIDGSNSEEKDRDRQIVRLFIYPDLLAAAVTIDINGAEGDPPFDDFLNLPELLVAQWEDAVYALNPHWLPNEDTEKKESK